MERLADFRRVFAQVVTARAGSTDFRLLRAPPLVAVRAPSSRL